MQYHVNNIIDNSDLTTTRHILRSLFCHLNIILQTRIMRSTTNSEQKNKTLKSAARNCPQSINIIDSLQISGRGPLCNTPQSKYWKLQNQFILHKFKHSHFVTSHRLMGVNRFKFILIKNLVDLILLSFKTCSFSNSRDSNHRRAQTLVFQGVPTLFLGPFLN